MTKMTLSIGQKVTYKGKNGIIARHPVKGYYDKETDEYWVVWTNNKGKRAGEFVPSEKIHEHVIMKKIAELALHRTNKLFNINEELTKDDFRNIRRYIRKEIATIFYDLFRKRTTWV